MVHEVVYFLGDDDIESYTKVKVGHTRRPIKERIRDLQTGNPEKLVLLAMVRGGYPLEQSFKRRFREYATTGGKEWFRRHDDLHQCLLAIRHNDMVPAAKPVEIKNDRVNAGVVRISPDVGAPAPAIKPYKPKRVRVATDWLPAPKEAGNNRIDVGSVGRRSKKQ